MQIKEYVKKYAFGFFLMFLLFSFCCNSFIVGAGCIVTLFAGCYFLMFTEWVKLRFSKRGDRFDGRYY